MKEAKHNKSHVAWLLLYEISGQLHPYRQEAGEWLLGLSGDKGHACLMGTGFPFGVMEMFWNLIEGVVAQHWECTKCLKWYTLEQLILWYVNSTSIKNNNKAP